MALRSRVLHARNDVLGIKVMYLKYINFVRRASTKYTGLDDEVLCV